MCVNMEELSAQSLRKKKTTIILMKVFALSCICSSAPDTSGRAPQSVSPPNKGPLREPREQRRRLDIKFLHNTRMLS